MLGYWLISIKCHARILCPVILPLKSDGEIKTFVNEKQIELAHDSFTPKKIAKHIF